jgi:large subunit ribosomal protein L24e
MKCSYCSTEVRKGQGIMFVYRQGSTSYFCSAKCYKNDIVLGRHMNKKTVRKTVAAQQAKR